MDNKKRTDLNCSSKVTSVITCKSDKKDNKKWQKPRLEDVSGRVMAQPYIRFT